MNRLLTTVIRSDKNKTNKKDLLYLTEIYKKVKIPYPMKQYYNIIIPPNLFQTWHTKDLPPLMKTAVNALKIINPRFNHYLYDDNDCREFIKNNFDDNVLNAYDSLIPGAYKADLWRYCILYKLGGIYLDIKYVCINGFKLINLLEKEHWILDADNKCVYNALMVCLPGNNILLEAINQIVQNVRNKYYGEGFLDPTGPGLLAKYFSDEGKKHFDMVHKVYSLNDKFILYNGYYILKSYQGHSSERDKYSLKKHYAILWGEKNIYKK